MGMSLNEFLADVDEWKRKVSDEMAGLSDTERHERGRQAVEWLETRIGIKLPAGEPPARRQTTQG